MVPKDIDDIPNLAKLGIPLDRQRSDVHVLDVD
jgi:hypothetical protein